MSGRKEVKELLREFERQGCSYRLARAGHWHVSYNGILLATCSSTPSDSRRTIVNTRTTVRRRLAAIKENQNG